MKILRLPALLLCAGVAFAMTNALSSAESTEAAYLRKREEYSAATKEIDELIRSGRLKEAENAVLLSEPKYARKWSLGRFGYGARMEIGQAYLDRGDVAEALRLFKSAKPGGGCGNCMASQHVQRNIRVARIYESRLNFPAAFASYLRALPSTSLGGGLGSVLFGLLKSGGICSVPILALVYFVRRRQKRGKKRTEDQPLGGAMSYDAGSPEHVAELRKSSWTLQKFKTLPGLVERGVDGPLRRYDGQPYDPKLFELWEDAWEHDHCVLCGQMLMEETCECDNAIDSGYTDGRDWICPRCFAHYFPPKNDAT